MDVYQFRLLGVLYKGCSCAAIRTFEVLPEYLKTKSRGKVNDYRDWSVPLGRRFRALKLWFVLRSFGLEGIREKLRTHIQLNQLFLSGPDFGMKRW